MKKPTISGNKIIVPSDPEYLNDVDVFIEGILRGYGADESIIADIAISVSELVNNAMLHGNNSEINKAVEVSIDNKNNKVEIVIYDNGAGFNPDDIDNPLDDSNLLKEVGRGIFIVKSLMDSVNIESTSQGTKVTIEKAI
ncbi:MAG: hypothetical protein DRP35_01605 [Candidatus Zixiibacteriota bacterium]|nr:MAG: hypothetical protein DRP35_01605 [candidate division Zixibacteria bacterium]